MAEDYEMLEELGSGSFGVVYKALDRVHGDLVAVKHIDLEGSDDDIREIQQEISLLSTCSSPYVTQYRTSFVRGSKLWIVMEYLGGGSCLDLLKPGPFPEGYIAIICRELLQGLHYLHTTGKIHRDIKAANILLAATGTVKIADFGVAAQLSNIKSQRMTFVGTPFWMAPEVIQENGYDSKADIWSLGITAMEMANAEPPNAKTHPMKVLFHIPKAPAPRLEGGRWSKDFRDFVAQCLDKDPDGRPTAKELLKHKFIQKAGRVEQLRDLIDRYQRYDAKHNKASHANYYEETMRDLSPTVEQDEWVFDTVKPVAAAKTVRHPSKRRKLARIDSAVQGEDPDLDGSPSVLEDFSVASAEQRPPIPGAFGSDTVRRSSASDTPTARRVSAVRVTSGGTPTARRVSGVGNVKQPLGLDMSFGNGTSTVKQFRRVSAEKHVPSKEYPPTPAPAEKSQQRSPTKVSKVPQTPSKSPKKSKPAPQPAPQDGYGTNPWANSQPSFIHDENTPPPPDRQAQVTPMQMSSPHKLSLDTSMAPPTPAPTIVSQYSTPMSQPRSSLMPPPGLPPLKRSPTSVASGARKDAQLARKAYKEILEPSFIETIAHTADPANREVIAKAAAAWAALDKIDPEGEWALLRLLVERLGADKDIAHSLGLDKQRTLSSPTKPARRQSNVTASPRNQKDRRLTSDAGIGAPSTQPSPTGTTSSTNIPAPPAPSSASSAVAAAKAPPLRRSNTSVSTTAVSKIHGQANQKPASRRPTAGTDSAAMPPPPPPPQSPKLILSRNNPHLKSHRRRQSAFVTPSAGGYAGADPLSALDVAASLSPAQQSSSSSSSSSFVDGAALGITALSLHEGGAVPRKGHGGGHHRRAESAWAAGERKERPQSMIEAGAVDEKGVAAYAGEQGLLGDVLYGRWLEGLRGRWVG